jgi:hypothetical protein
MSEIANKVYETIRELFPHNIVLAEWYINYKGQRLFFDVFLKDLGVLVEIQGRQHFEFVSHFHGSMEGFINQKKRDNLKLEYIEEHEKLCLARFNYDEDITKELIMKRIHEALDSEVGYD